MEATIDTGPVVPFYPKILLAKPKVWETTLKLNARSEADLQKSLNKFASARDNFGL